jgi:pimeloyl-ACP methyl ester carboxylesterase
MAHITLYPIRATLGRLVRMVVAPYLVADAKLLASAKKAYEECTPTTNNPIVLLSNDEKYKGKVSITTELNDYDGICYTLEPSSAKNIHSTSDKLSHMVVFEGNGMLVDTNMLKEWAYFAEDNNIRITVVQHPGVLEKDKDKKPMQFDDLIDNGAQVFKAIQKQYGLQASDIGLYGHSMGGAIAVQVATRFNEPAKKQCPYVFVDRSFVSVARVPVAWILRDKPKTVRDAVVFWGLKVPLALVVFCIVKPLLLLTGWEAHTGLHYALLPKNRKHHVFVRQPKKEDQTLGDEVIPRLASLDSALSVKIPYWVQKYHTKWFETKEQYELFKQERARFKVFPNSPEDRGHNASLLNPAYQMKIRGPSSEGSKNADNLLADWVTHSEKASKSSGSDKRNS